MIGHGFSSKLIGAALGACLSIAAARVSTAQEPTLEKIQTGGSAEIGIALPAATAFQFTIVYSNPSSVRVRIYDAVPAEFEVLGIAATAGTVEHFKANSKANGQARAPNSATVIIWDLDAGTSGMLVVDIQTVPNPGHARRGLTAYKPLTCGPLSLNDGAVALEVDPETGELVLVEVVDPVTLEVSLEPVVVASSSGLEVTAIAGAKPCEEEEEEE